MQRLGITLIAMAALLTGFYFSAQHFAEPLPASLLTPGGNLIGDRRPDFSLGSYDGELVTASDFDGKTLLINFWATWCAPCRREMPILMDLQGSYGEDGLEVIGIALDDVESVANFVKTYGISYTILAGTVNAMEVSSAYGNIENVLPYSVLVDKQGIIRWQYTGEIQLTDIKKLLAKYL